MRIETKFNIGDEVWLMWENMAVSAVVKEMHIEVSEKKWCVVRAECYCKITNPHFTREKHESLLFPTKEELLKSL